MKSYASRFGLVVDHNEGKSVVTGIDCNLSEVNEITAILGFQSDCFEDKDKDDFEPLLNFHEAINEAK